MTDESVLKLQLVYLHVVNVGGWLNSVLETSSQIFLFLVAFMGPLHQVKKIRKACTNITARTP